MNEWMNEYDWIAQITFELSGEKMLSHSEMLVCNVLKRSNCLCLKTQCKWVVWVSAQKSCAWSKEFQK